MNLSRKKALAAKTLKVGKNRICFNIEGLSEIKEAITKQDIKDLYKEGIITIKPVKGRKKIKKRKIKRGPGKIKKKIRKRKQTYVKITRKLRAYLKQLKAQGKISNEVFWQLRNRIRMRDFRSKAHLKEYLETNKIISVEPKEIAKEKPKKKVKKKVKKPITKEKKKPATYKKSREEKISKPTDSSSKKLIEDTKKKHTKKPKKK